MVEASLGVVVVNSPLVALLAIDHRFEISGMYTMDSVDADGKHMEVEDNFSGESVARVDMDSERPKERNFWNPSLQKRAYFNTILQLHDGGARRANTFGAWHL